MPDAPRPADNDVLPGPGRARRPPRVVHVEISLRTIGLVLATLATVWLFIRLWTVVLMVIFALVLVGTLNPLVGALERRGLRRGWAVLLILLGLLIVTSLLALLTLPPLFDQLLELLEAAPAKRDLLIEWLQQRPLTAPLAQLVRDSGSGEAFTALGSSLLDYSSQGALVVGYAATSVMLAFYILADIQRARGSIYTVVPRRYHVRLARILIELEIIVGGYVRGQLITSAAIALFTFGLLSICQVPNALPLAVFAGLTDVIPFIGGLLATAPAVLGALSVSTTVAIVVLAAMILYQEFESRILVPRIYGRVLRLSAATVILALLIGGTLLGILGAFLALPLAAGLMMVMRELRVEMPGDDRHNRDLHARDAQDERTYQQLSAGARPQEAAEIAADMARASREVTALETAVDPKSAAKSGPARNA